MALICAVTLWDVQGICAQTAAPFTYQGKVSVSGAPPTANYDFEFKLFDGLTGGTQQGSTVTLTSVAVADGLFSVQLDFGVPVFDGTDRFLEIGLRAAGGGSFTTLSPRQLITNSPYSIHSSDAAKLGGLGASEYVRNSTLPQPNVSLNIGGDGTIGGTMSAGVVNTTGEFRVNDSRILSGDASNNTVIGIAAGGLSAPGKRAPAIGGANNTLVGASAGLFITTGSSNAFFGAEAGRSNTVGSSNSFFGYRAGFSNVGGGANTGNFNSFFGSEAGAANTGGRSNVFFGYHAGFSNVSSSNVIVGAFAGELNTQGTSNTFVGFTAGRNNTDGTNNTFIGTSSGGTTTTGSGNTFIGKDASAGLTGQSNFNNTLVGFNAKAIGNAFFNSAAIGANALVETANAMVLGGINGVNLATSDTDVAIGTTSPIAALHVQRNAPGTLGPRLVLYNAGGGAGSAASIDFHTYDFPTVSPGARIMAVDDGNFGGHLTFRTKPPGSASFNTVTERMRIQSDGKVGIGTSSPDAPLHVVGPGPGAVLHVVGTSKTSVLEITGGSDLAEHFEIIEDAKPGMLVAIDTHHTGKLSIARGAYNRRVAGVISGANHLAAGMVLPDPSGAKKSMPVALSGRVWVYCDATKHPIKLGDLLTTSTTPGHAMKVISYTRAQGAIIGKAMTALPSGRGLVLTLVALQ